MDTGRVGPLLQRAVRGLLATALLCAAACHDTPRTVIEPVFRLTRLRAEPRPKGVPPACAAGDERRPSFGCPPFLSEAATITRIAPDRIRLSAKTPGDALGRDVVVVPVVRLVPGTTPETLAHSVLRKVGATITTDAAFDSTRLSDASSAQLRVHVLEPFMREYRTRPVTLPENAELTVGLAVSELAEESQAVATEFRLDAQWDGGTRRLIDESLPASASGRWHDRRMDLADLAGQKVTFRFVTVASAGPEGLDGTAAYPVWGAPQVLAPRLRDGRLNLLLVSLDTVRADYLGGALRGVRLTPWFDRLAREGTTFSEVVSTFSSTSASHMSLFTGVYPPTHGVRHPSHRLPDAIDTLPQMLARAGYSTAAVTEDAMILAGSGFGRGFDSYRENRDTMGHAGAVGQTFAEGVDWLEHHPHRLFFLFLHTYEAHSPYAPTAEALDAIPEIDADASTPAARNLGKMRRAYAAEVHYTDQALERLFSELERLDALDRTLVVVTADHGEEFGEHGLLGHAKTVYDEVLRVPLLFWAPGTVPAGRVVDEQISLVDVAPTILDLLGLPRPPKIPGRSVAGALRGGPVPGNDVRFAEGLYGDVRMVTARTRDHKWIWYDDGSELRVYDLRADPGEKAPLDDPALREEGRALIEAYLTLDESKAPARARLLDEKTRSKLEALGYTQ